MRPCINQFASNGSIRDMLARDNHFVSRPRGHLGKSLPTHPRLGARQYESFCPELESPRLLIESKILTEPST